jgi:FKBP-type peptidyl-prolyl cis-trans isomerase FkpA/FKBP-type peptidyl-prolyl cis-trans isomerase FklB
MRRAVLLGLFSLAVTACTEGGVRSEIERAAKKRAESAKGIAQKSRAYLDENGKKPGVRTTASGLQYSVTRAVETNLPKPVLGDQVLVNYEGKLVDGTVFDSSYERGQPVPFTLGEVIPGWNEGVQLMKPGEEFLFVVPAELGYGAQGAGGDIPPDAALIFKVELLMFAKKDGTIVRPE